MNALVHSRAWLLLGWSMIHFLWVGGAVLIATGVLRLLLQRATPNVRYAVAVATLVILVASPALVAVRLAPRSLADAESGVARRLATRSSMCPISRRLPRTTRTGRLPRRKLSQPHRPSRRLIWRRSRR